MATIEAVKDVVHAQLSALIGEPSRRRRVAADPVSAAQIRRWLEAFGDGHRHYLEGGLESQIAPRAMLGCFSGKGLLETRASEEASAFSRIIAEHGLVPPGVGMAQDYSRDIRVGDHIHETTIIESISDKKVTPRSGGYFVTMRTDFTNQHGESLGTQRVTCFAMKPLQSPAASPAPEQAKSTPAIAPVAGDALPGYSITLDRMGIIACTAACGDFNPGHYDPAVAQRQGFGDIFTDIYSAIGFSHRLLTQWAGPDARVDGIDLRLGSSFYAGDTLTMGGAVTARDGDVTHVALRGTCSTGVHLHGTATVTR